MIPNEGVTQPSSESDNNFAVGDEDKYGHGHGLYKETLNYFFWNVHGFYNHMNNSELRLYLERYMFVGLCETWVESKNILYLDKLKSWLSGYSCFVKGAYK